MCRDVGMQNLAAGMLNNNEYVEHAKAQGNRDAKIVSDHVQIQFIRVAGITDLPEDMMLGQAGRQHSRCPVAKTV